LLTPNDVPASKFIEKLAKYLKENVEEITPPAWASMAKTGAHVQRLPDNPDWWYVRCASLLRKIYIHGPIGIERLRAAYGSRKDFGIRPEHAVRAGGSAVRKAMQQLEAAGFLEKVSPNGRRITKEGRKQLDAVAEDLKKELLKEVPALEKYAKGG
jgi:small subunit ribosomal protein S19e